MNPTNKKQLNEGKTKPPKPQTGKTKPPKAPVKKK